MSLEHPKFENKHAIFSVRFQTSNDNCFGITDFRVILNNISDVKLIFLFEFQYVTYKTKLKTNKYCLIA